MKYIIRFWATLIGLIFALSATIITATLGLAFSIILFVCALACTPIFYFFPNATDIIEQATHIVTSPLQFAGSTISAVWSQLLNVVTGRARTSNANEAARVTASTAMLLAFSAACFVAVAISPLSNYLTIVGYIVASLIVVVVWAAAAIRFSHGSRDVIRISAICITLATCAATLTIIVVSSLKSWTFALAFVVLLFLSAISLVSVWEDTNQSQKPNRSRSESASGPRGGSRYRRPGQQSYGDDGYYSGPD